MGEGDYYFKYFIFAPIPSGDAKWLPDNSSSLIWEKWWAQPGLRVTQARH
jgi:hypothetical protein